MTAGPEPRGARAPPRERGRVALLRAGAVLGTSAVVLVPLGIVFYQAFLDAPFFQPGARLSLDAFRFVLADPDFHRALWVTAVVAAGMTAIAVPVGTALAMLVVRTDLPGRRVLEPWLLVPMLVSPVVLAFGYVVAAGPVGFLSTAVKEALGFLPWDVYSLPSLVVVAGLGHAPHVYLYAASALRSVGSDLEDAARVAGAGPFRVALDVTLPLVRPAVLYGGVLVFFLGFELFGLPLVLGDPEGLVVLSTYLYKLTNKLGVPSYQLMAVVAVVIVAIAFPLVALQRRLLGAAGRYVTTTGKGQRVVALPLGRWRLPALAAVLAYVALAVALPLAGVLLRSVVTSWGEGIRLREVLTLDNFRDLLDYPNVVRGIGNTVLVGVVGGAAAVAIYAAVGLAGHRWRSRWTHWLEVLVLVPRGMPGLVAGLAFLWVFLFVKPLAPLRQTLVAVWLAYSVVWFAYGMRFIQAALLQVGPELEEAARVAGAGPARALRDVTLPLVRFGLLGSWLMIFLTFVREYSTGVYLLGPGTEVIGSLIVSMWGTGAVDTVAALSVVNVLLVAAGLAAALRLGVRLDE